MVHDGDFGLAEVPLLEVIFEEESDEACDVAFAAVGLVFDIKLFADQLLYRSMLRQLDSFMVHKGIQYHLAQLDYHIEIYCH